VKHLLLVLAACAAVTTAAAQGPGIGRPDGWRDRDRLDPEVRAALQDYCRIMRVRHERNRAIQVPRICYRLFPDRRYPQ